MMRTILLLTAGAALGAAALHLAPFRSGPDDAPPRPDRSPARVPDRPAAVAPQSAPDHEAPDAGAATVEGRVLAVAAEPPSPDRTLRLAALLLRHAETDPAGAVRLARRVRADEAVTRLLFIGWAGTDMEAALAEIGALDDRDEARAIAMSVLGSIGNDDDNAERLARALPSAERSAFLAEAIAARGDASPRAALRQALAIDDIGARSLALARLAAVWAAADPRQALLHVDQIRNEQEREMFRAVVLAEWAAEEPRAVLDYVVELDAEQQRALLGIVHRVPEEQLALLLAEAGRFDSQTAMLMRQSVVQRMAQTDPAHAVSVVATLPTYERQQVQGAIAHAYGAKDPEAALAWAQSLQPRDPQVLMNVLAGVATADPERALDLALALDSPLERERAVGMVAGFGLRGGLDAEHWLNRLAALDDAARERAMQSLLAAWSSSDPRRAFEWLAANTQRAPADAFQQVGAQFAQQDPGAAAALTDRVPAAARPGWVAAVASGYASRDPDGALAWIAQFRNDPAYRDAVATAAMVLAQRDGAAAARLLETGGPLDEAAVRAAGAVVAQWVQQDPAAAAAWAAGLEPRARSMALTMAAQQWSARDPEGARRWALGMPPGEARDEALVGLSTAPFSRALPDEELLAAFSNDTARDRALVQMAVRLVQAGDVDRARTLIDQRVSNESMRANARAMLERAGEIRQRPFFAPAVPMGAYSAVPGAIGSAPVVGAALGAAIDVMVPAPPPGNRPADR